MSKENDLIEQKVRDFVSQQTMFTSVDIANAIKTDGIWINNSTVASWLRNNFDIVNQSTGDNYCIKLIDVANNTHRAYLYYPFFCTPDSYANKDAVAITPDQFYVLHSYKYTDSQAQPDGPSVQSTTSINVSQPSQTTTTSVQKVVSIDPRTLVGKAQGRIRIPGAIIKALGLLPGDVVALSDKINIPNLSKNITVQNDYRVSIPRSILSLGNGPVRMALRDGKLKIEKV